MDIFYAIAEPTRRSIVEMLAKKGRLSATAIGSTFNVSAPAISQHLKVLREARLVTVEKQGQQRIYQLNMDSVNEIEKWTHTMKQSWDKRLDKLDAVLQAEKNKSK